MNKTIIVKVYPSDKALPINAKNRIEQIHANAILRKMKTFCLSEADEKNILIALQGLKTEA